VNGKQIRLQTAAANIIKGGRIMEDVPVFHCELEITGTKHGEWQGIVRTDKGDRKFCSALELLCLMHAEVGPPMNRWDDRK